MLFNYLKDKHVQIFISIIWGFGLAMIFKRSCNGRQCIVIKGPKPEDMHNKIFKHDNKCYKYSAETTACKVDSKTIESRS